MRTHYKCTGTNRRMSKNKYFISEINLMVHKLLSAGIFTDEKKLCLRFKSQQEKKLKEEKHEEKKSKVSFVGKF
jgi:hypothetical protein